jgi:hypothetical protein
VIPLGGLVNAAGGLLFVALGLWVATLRPKNAATTAFAAFSIAFGAFFVPQNLFDPAQPASWNSMLLAASGLAAIPAAAAVLLLAVRGPRPHGDGRFDRLALPLGSMAVLLLVNLGAFAMEFPPTFRALLGDDLVPAFVVLTVVAQVMFAAQWAAAILWAQRFRALPPEDVAGRRQLAVMAAGVVMFPAFLQATFAAQPDFALRATGIANIAAAVLHAGLWLRAAAEGGGSSARNAALFPLGMCLAALVLDATLGGYAALDAAGVFGVVRTLGVAALAYAILRHQLLGIDVKVRWTIKQSTVAAVFIAVLFVVSELAKEFFAGAANSTLIGIAAAGMLVFAIAPLQRAAERVASVVVPLSADARPGTRAPEPARGVAKNTGIYRDAARYALRDGVVSRAEHLHLAELATALRLSPEEAFHLREEAEADLAASRRRAAGEVRR